MNNQGTKIASDKNIHQSEDVFLERIPNDIYQKMIDLFSNQYHFKNGEKMRIANYFVGISKSLSDTFMQFIEEITQNISENKYPLPFIPEGFETQFDNLLSTEANGNFSFASFDMAVAENNLQNIEFQAIATYPISAAKINQLLLDNLSLKNAYVFADNPSTSWSDFIKIYENIIADKETEGIIITDRLLKEQKTNFEFYATQKELNVPIDIVDTEEIFEKDNNLFYSKNKETIKINRLYNRVLISEALFEDKYPQNTKMWKFRFDKKYQSLKFINHPVKLYEVSKRLSPYIQHPYNPDCFELSEVVEDFQNGILKFEDYIWKHKWGAAGHRLILAPNLDILYSLSNDLENYIAQKKVNFKIFKTDDGKEKIVELRFMTATHNNKTIVVPMARIGHVTQNLNGITEFRIHFGDNNQEGYGFSPVIILDDKK